MTQPQSPPPGWYPDPTGRSRLRWWDGVTWGADDQTYVAKQEREQGAPDSGADDSAPGWGQIPAVDTNDPSPSGEPPTPPGPTASTAGWGQIPPAGPAAQYAGVATEHTGRYGPYAPPQSELAPSGLRRVPALFTDAALIFKRAWLPLLTVGLTIWLAWSAILLILAAFLIDVSKLITAFEVTANSDTVQSGGSSPASQQELNEAWDAVLRTTTPAVWIGFGIVMALLLAFAAAYQLTATTKLAMEASSGRPARFADALRSGFPAALRFTGWMLVFAAAFMAAAAAVAIAVIGLASLGGFGSVLAGLFAFAGFIGIMAATFWITGRLLPLVAQVLIGRHALAWSWGATRGKFWAVMGRYLLWSIAASIALQIVGSALAVPFYALSLIFVGGPPPTWLLLIAGLILLVFWAINMTLSVLTMLGVVPIWRDLTDDSRYRSIGPDGLPVAASETPSPSAA